MKVLEDIGSGVIRQLAYVGGLTIQFWSGLRATPRVLPVVGRRGRWLSAIRQMSAIGVDALPMIATVSMSSGFIFAMQSGAELVRHLGRWHVHVLQHEDDVVHVPAECRNALQLASLFCLI